MGEYFFGNWLFILLILSVASFLALKFMDKIIAFLCRGVFGITVIFLLDLILSPLKVAVGLNVVTFLASAFLGLPSLALMFGLAFLMK